MDGCRPGCSPPAIPRQLRSRTPTRWGRRLGLELNQRPAWPPSRQAMLVPHLVKPAPPCQLRPSTSQSTRVGLITWQDSVTSSGAAPELQALPLRLYAECKVIGLGSSRLNAQRDSSAKGKEWRSHAQLCKCSSPRIPPRSTKHEMTPTLSASSTQRTGSNGATTPQWL